MKYFELSEGWINVSIDMTVETWKRLKVGSNKKISNREAWIEDEVIPVVIREEYEGLHKNLDYELKDTMIWAGGYNPGGSKLIISDDLWNVMSQFNLCEYFLYELDLFAKKNHHTYQLTDYELGFLDIIGDVDNKYEKELFSKENNQKVLAICQDFYEDYNVERKHLYIQGIILPSENKPRWELIYGVTFGDLMVYLIYEGWDFKYMTSAD